jgi:FKBP-type peptidyl-prolyl cis-trans isomerase (trigger factor)
METIQNNKKITYIIVLIAVILFGYVIYSVIQNNKNKNMKINSTTENVKTEAKIAEAGDIIVINYSGKLANGTEFDSSYKRGQPFIFQVGVGQVIKGWDEGLIGAKRGDKKTLTITPDKGYGTEDVKGQDGKVIIPKNSTLIFDVEVVEVISKVDAERMMAEQKAAQMVQGSTTKKQ